MRQEQVFAPFGRILWMFGLSLGLEAQALLALAGVTREQLEDPDGLIDVEVLLKLWSHYSERFPDEPLGLRYASLITLEQLGLVGHLILNSPTLAESIERFMRFQRLIDPLMRLELRSYGAFAEITVDYDLQGFAGKAQLMEMFLGVMCSQNVRMLSGQDRPYFVNFAHPQRHPDALYEGFFSVPVRFDQPTNNITFDRELLSRPYEGAVASVGHYLERYMESLTSARSPAASPPLAPEEAGITAQAQAFLAEHLRLGRWQCQDVAQALGLSVRTLQRRLSDEGTSFAQVLSKVRHAQALYLLETSPSPIYEIAFLLGYQDAASFYRAFKQWTGGRTPESYRQAER